MADLLTYYTEVRVNIQVSADVGSQIMAPMKKAKKPPKWACSRNYIEGKLLRPTAVKLWCNQGKTLIKLKTPGLKPGTAPKQSRIL